MTTIPVSSHVRWIAASFLLLAPIVGSAAKPFTRVVAFGDSLSDPGNVFAVTGQHVVAPYDVIPGFPYAIGGNHFTNGKTWIEQLASTLSVPQTAKPALRAPGTFTNYAFGGATACPSISSEPTDLTAQVAMYLGDVSSSASAGALYVLWFGGDDLRYALAQPDFPASAGQIIGCALQSIADNMEALAAAGAKSFLVPNVANIGAAPAIAAFGPGAQAAASQLSVSFNAGLQDTLNGVQAQFPGIHIYRLDVFSLTNEVSALPQKFGLTDTTDTCLSFGVIAHAICAQPNKYLFWDGIHPTTAGHRIIAEAAAGVLPQ